MLSKLLKKLLKEHKKRKVSDEERAAQRISFAYGNVKMSNDKITRELVEAESVKVHDSELEDI